MATENFDYKLFSIEMKKQAYSLIPKDINADASDFICDTIENFINISGEAISKESSFTAKQQSNCCQIIAEWTFHKTIDVIRAGIPREYWDAILQSIAFTVYNIILEAYKRGLKQEQMLQIVEYQVNKNFRHKLDELYAKSLIDKTHHTEGLFQSNINRMAKENDHNECYSLENNQYQFLNDNVTVAYARNLAYRYLLKAAHCLKKVSMKANDRQNILYLLRHGVVNVINLIQASTFNFSIPQAERIITVSMELFFHRIVVMYKNNILSNDNWSKECVSYFASTIYAIEFSYVKEKYKLKDVYEYTNVFSNQQLKDYFNEFIEDNTFTQEQVNKAFGKSYITYLEKEICKLMKAKKLSNTLRNWLLFFLIYFILKLIYYFFFK